MAEPVKLTPHKSRRFGRLVIVVGALAVVLMAGGFLWRYFNTYESTDDAQIDGHINAVSARITGSVIAINAEDQQFVNAGDVLVKLDPKDYEIAVARAEADLADAEAALESSRTGIPITSTNTSSQLKSAQASRGDAAASIFGRAAPADRRAGTSRFLPGAGSRRGSQSPASERRRDALQAAGR